MYNISYAAFLHMFCAVHCVFLLRWFHPTAAESFLHAAPESWRFPPMVSDMSHEIFASVAQIPDRFCNRLTPLLFARQH